MGRVRWCCESVPTASRQSSRLLPRTRISTGCGRPPGFSFTEAATQLVQFIGYFLAIGSVGFRFGIVRRVRGITEEARVILRTDNAALLGIVGVLLVALTLVGGPYIDAVTHGKTFAAALPKNIHPLEFEFELGMLALALVGFMLVRAAPSLGWILATIGVLFEVLQLLYTGKFSSKANAVHVLAASTWLGTLLVLAIVGIHGVIRSRATPIQRAAMVSDLVNSFSPLALTAAAITGVTAAWLHLKRISALYTFAALVLIATSVLVTLPSPR